MPPKKKTTVTPRTTTPIETRKLEKLIRDTMRSEMTAQQSRNRTADAYIQRLHDTDARITDFIQQAITETSHAYRLSVNSFVISYVAAFLILMAGILLISFGANTDRLFVIAVIFIVVSIIWMITLQNRNLTKNNRSSVNNLAKLNIIFAGYIRQIHQIDALFEELRQSDNGITFQATEQLLNSLQDAMAEAITATAAASNELDT